MNFKRSILDIGRGAIVENVDNELQKVMHNLVDVGTDDKPRTITLKITLTPENEKKELNVSYNVSSTLRPKKSQKIHMFNHLETDTETGEVIGMKLQEHTGVMPGQINLDGVVAEQVEPIVIGIGTGSKEKAK